MNSVQGMVIIEIRDADTLELKNTITKTNVINISMFYNDLQLPSATYGWNSNSGSTAAPANIAVSGRIIKPNNPTLILYGTGQTSYSDTSYPGHPATNYEKRIQSSTVTAWEFTDGSPPYVERKGRFDSPATIQTINSIYLTGASNINRPATSIGLTTPCIQNPGEVLDITYRIQFYETASLNSAGAWTSPTLFRHGYIATRLFPSQQSASPHNVMGSFLQMPDTSQYNELRRFAVVQNPLHILTTYDGDYSYDYFKMVFNSIIEKDEWNGEIFSTAHIGGRYTSSYLVPNAGTTELPVHTSTEMVMPMMPDGFAFKPIQPIQNHSKDAIEWGLDVDFLATSQGNLTVNGDNWTNPDWPEFWRVEFTKTGAVGTSNYYFRNRRLLGFNDISYTPKLEQRCWDMFNNKDTTTIATHDRGHGIHSMENNEEYGVDSYIAWDDTGINIHRINKTLIIAYDATTTPALPVTYLRHVAVDGSDNIWVACKDTGLYRITTPWNPATATITRMTSVTNSLFPTSDAACYGVATGTNGSIWAVLDGALSHTTNPTATTPTFTNYNPTTPTVFDYTEVTNDWTQVKYLRVDRNSPDNELAVIFRTGNNEKIAWWSLAGVAYEGPESGSHIGSYPNNDNWGIHAVNVSHRGNMWGRVGPNFNDPIQLLVWGTTSNFDRSVRNSEGYSTPTFLYDYYDTPYFGNSGILFDPTSTSSKQGIAITSPDGISFATAQSYGGITGGLNATTGMTWQNRRAGGMAIYVSDWLYYAQYYRQAVDEHVINQFSPHYDHHNDPLNGQHSPSEELCWDKYHWNGSAWELNYFAPAIDTSSGTAYPADRHNFDTESHRFTGRSMIDASAAFDANNFSAAATATFAANITLEAKEDSSDYVYDDRRAKKQDFPVTIFDFSTKTRRLKLMVKTLGTSSIALYEDGTETILATGLVNGNTHRIVASINGTSVDVYVDSVQVGSTVTLSSAFDWTNTTPELKAYIGCRAYYWEIPQRHATWEAEFFRGYMTNVQLWNVAWNTTDISNDFANTAGVIVSQPGANLIARYELTQSLEGLETKATHATAEIMDEGITIAFNEGTSGDSFVATDYYTFGVVDGVLKDNSMSFTRAMSVYHKPVDHEFTTFKNESGTSVIEGAATSQVIEPVIFKGNQVLINNSSSATPANDQRVVDQYPGKLYRAYAGSYSTGNSWSWSGIQGGQSHQFIENDGYFEFSPAAADTHAMCGLTDDTTILPNDSSNGNHLVTAAYMMRLEPNGTIDIVENGILIVADVGTYTLDTIFRIRKTSTVVTYHIDDGVTETLLHTSSIAATAPLYAMAVFPYQSFGIVDAVMSYTRLDNMLTIGDPITLTGSFNPNFLLVDSQDPTSYEIFIDGNPAVVIEQHDVTYQEIVFPAVGEVYLDGKAGWLIFNSADIGKTVTGRVTVIYDEL